MGFSMLPKSRLAERISVAIFVAGMTFSVQAEHCVQGTLCYPDPSDMCGPTGPLWCSGGEDPNSPEQPFTITIPHMRDNPYSVSCGVSDQAQMLRSLSFDILSFARSNNNYSEWYGSPPYVINLNNIQFYMTYSDGSFVELFNGGALAPGTYDPAIFSNPIGPYHIIANGYYATVPFATMYLGPDASGYAFAVEHVGLVDYRNPNVSVPPLCLKIN